MSQLNLYKNGWTNLVFEGRNKEYGAYQLRQENPRTTTMAFFAACLLMVSLVSIPSIMKYFKGDIIVANGPTIFSLPTMTAIQPPQLPEKAVLPVTQKSEVKPKPTLTKKPILTADKNTPTTEQPLTPTTNTNSGNTNTNPSTPENGGNTSPTTAVVVPTLPKDNSPKSPAVLDKQPNFPGGIERFYQYVGDNFDKENIEEGLEVKVLVSFVIEKNGMMTDIHVIKKTNTIVDDEAIRVLKSLKTKWSPGIKDGEAVRTQYTLPIIVRQ